jgi:hypothetical protein
MSFSSSPSRTRGHLLPPLHREVSSQPPPPAVQAGEPAGSPDVSHGDKPSGEARTGPGAEARGRTWGETRPPVRYSILVIMK